MLFSDNCACCGTKLNEDNVKVWNERHFDLISSTIGGGVRRDTYRKAEYEEAVCTKCFRALKRNSIIIPLISWLLAVFLPVSFCFIKLPTIFILFLAFWALWLLVSTSSAYSFLGLILSPILGKYETHPSGEKETDYRLCFEQKKEKIKRYLMKHYKINEFDAEMAILYSRIEQTMEEDFPKYKRIKTKDLALCVAPNREALLSLLKPLHDAYHKAVFEEVRFEEIESEKIREWCSVLPLDVVRNFPNMSEKEILELINKCKTPEEYLTISSIIRTLNKIRKEKQDM